MKKLAMLTRFSMGRAFAFANEAPCQPQQLRDGLTGQRLTTQPGVGEFWKADALAADFGGRV